MCSWRIALLERFWQAPHPPRYAAFTPSSSPSSRHSSRVMYLGSSLYRIHGSNEPHTMGQAVSSGCIRMTNPDVVDLYRRVRIGTIDCIAVCR
jgi:lipoprotein-anchoring transpeptidase ErfK/SrfK